MPQADKYKLVVSPLSGTVFISAISKKDPNCMTDDRRVVPKNEFLAAIMHYAEHETSDSKSDTMNITCGGEVVAEIKLLKKKVKKPAKKQPKKDPDAQVCDATKP